MMAMGYRSVLRSWVGVLAVAALFTVSALGGSAHAAEQGGQAAAAQPAINTGDTAWVLVSAALVMLMTPALAFFYGGLVRRKNMLSVLMQCLMILCLISLQWTAFGYSLSFGPDKGSLIGSLGWAFLKGVGMGPNADYAATIPHQAFMMFQRMFAVITPALIIGAFAERMKFSALCIFTLLWATFVYDPVAHWIWGMIATGIFASKAVNPAGADGLLYGNPGLLWIQIKAAAITIAYSFVVGIALLKLVNAFVTLRVGEHEERVGLDLTMHREAAYTVID